MHVITQILESSRSSEEPATFEIGAGDVVGNNLYQAFDEAVRGLAVGDSVKIKVESRIVDLNGISQLYIYHSLFT